jgi:hypothetical protein
MNIEDAINVIESVSGFTDESTPVGGAWQEVLSYLYRPPVHSEVPPRETERRMTTTTTTSTSTRTVIVNPYLSDSEPSPGGQAQFHGFGFEYVELENGTGNYTVAIVEWPDGTVETVALGRIKFVSPLQAES